MAVEDDIPDLDEFDRPDLRLSPEMHRAQAEMAAERGEDYDPYEFEASLDEPVEQPPDPVEDAESVEGHEERFREWRESVE